MVNPGGSDHAIVTEFNLRGAMIKRRRATSAVDLGFRWMELWADSAVTIAARTVMMVSASPASMQAETGRMVSEKLEAFTSAAIASGEAAGRMDRVGPDFHVSIMEAWLAPVHRAARANARRLIRK